MSQLTVAVIFGGRSVEHEISVISAVQCMHVIDKNKYRVFPIYITKQGIWYTGDHLLDLDNYKNIDKLLAKCDKILVSQNSNDRKIYKAHPGIFGKKELATIDIAFPVIHGTYGEDGILQGLLELMNVPYVGCDVLAAAATMDKICTKMILKSIGVPVLDDVSFTAEEWMADDASIKEKIFAKFYYPLIVKPSNLGSSVGISSVENDYALEDAIALALSMAPCAIVEPKVVNLKEVNCSVLGDRASLSLSVCEEPLRSGEVLSYADKYLGGAKGKSKIAGKNDISGQGMSSTKRRVPADISEELKEKIYSYAKTAFINLNCSGVVRIDFLIDQDSNKVYLCELNTIPGSLAFYLWEPLGKNFTELTDDLIALALKRHREKNNLILSYDTNILKDFRSGAKMQGKK